MDKFNVASTVASGGGSKALTTGAGLLFAKTGGLTALKNQVVQGVKNLIKMGSSGGPGAENLFQKKTKAIVKAESGNTCVFCKKPTTNTPGPNQSNVDHAIPKSRGETIQ